MIKKEVLGVFILLIIIFNVSIISSFEVKNILLKISLNKGDSIVKNVSVYSSEEGQMKLSIEGFEKGVNLEEDSFILKSNEEKQIKVLFDSNYLEEGVHVGNIKFRMNGKEKILPVIFEIESKDVFFDANSEIPVKYSEIYPDEKIVVQVNIFNLISGGGLQTSFDNLVDVEYKIHDLNGNILISEKESLVVDRQILVTKTFILPKNIKIGDYVFSVVVKYKSSVGVTSNTFKIIEKKFTLFEENKSFFVILGGFFLSILILFYIFIIHEEKLFLKLKKQQTSELKFYSKKIDEEKEKSLEKARTEREKEKIINEFNDAKNKIIKEIKKQQAKQREELKKLRKQQRSEKTIRNKLREWRKEIYPKAVKSAEINHELKMKLMALKKAYEKGYISKESYKKGKSRIKKKLEI